MKSLTSTSAGRCGQERGPFGCQLLAWQNEQISRVIAGGHAASTHPREIEIDGRKCVVGSKLHFDVRDEFAFDIDETVELHIDFYVGSSAERAVLTYDRSDVAPAYNGFVDPAAVHEIELSAHNGRPWCTQVFSLERARFANSGFCGTDFSISAHSFGRDTCGSIVLNRHDLIVGGIAIKRTFTTARPSSFGVALIEVVDELGRRTPVRMGIYDASGRLPLPSDQALRLRGFNGASRIIALRAGATLWPVKNQSVFYVDGTYHPTLPAGDYEVVVAKGPEYSIARESFTIVPNQTVKVKLKMRRFIDMAARGWYSGDGHVHYERASAQDDRDLLVLMLAENLNVANILLVGNSGATYFRHYDWREVANGDPSTYVLVPGQEDPRTSRRGHTIQLNLRQPIRDPARYLLYHECFAATRSQGGVAGYAHAYGDEGALEIRAGLALDVPFGLIDFVEIIQGQDVAGALWFDFLNLGFKLSPSAGTDYPYIDVPGAVRNYVYVGKEFSSKAWFDSLKSGRTFVSNGPMLEFEINKQGMGSHLKVKPGGRLSIKATAIINPDVDQLDRIELIEQGEIIKTVSSSSGDVELNLEHTTAAQQGSWFVLRAVGSRLKQGQNTIALSAPIYVQVNDQSFWRPSLVPQIVESLKRQMRAMLLENVELLESWDTHEADNKHWELQKTLLEQRIESATTLYDDLIIRARCAVEQNLNQQGIVD